ncbi:MAG: type II toxin-antitoxin system PemK/MazF family toxin [Acidobacteriota bacterium]
MTTPVQNLPKRGDIFWASLPAGESAGSEQHGTRPVLVISVDIINENLPICVIVPLSNQLHKENRHHRIRIVESEKIQEPGTRGCPGDSLALTEQLRCISRNRLDANRVARLKPIAMGAVEAGIKYVLGLP